MKQNLKFGLSQISNYAPVWVVNATSVVVLIITAKHYLIYNLPITTEEVKLIMMTWADYILDVVQVLLAVVVIFSGLQNTNHHDTVRN